MGESSRLGSDLGRGLGRESGGRSGSRGNGRSQEQLGLPMRDGMDASGTDPSERLMLALEERVIGLMERFDEARKRIGVLENELSERTAQLEASGAQHEVLKEQLRERLGRVIDRIAELEERESSRGQES